MSDVSDTHGASKEADGGNRKGAAGKTPPAASDNNLPTGDDGDLGTAIVRAENAIKRIDAAVAKYEEGTKSLAEMRATLDKANERLDALQTEIERWIQEGQSPKAERGIRKMMAELTALLKESTKSVQVTSNSPPTIPEATPKSAQELEEAASKLPAEKPKLPSEADPAPAAKAPSRARFTRV